MPKKKVPLVNLFTIFGLLATTTLVSGCFKLNSKSTGSNKTEISSPSNDTVDSSSSFESKTRGTLSLTSRKSLDLNSVIDRSVDFDQVQILVGRSQKIFLSRDEVLSIKEIPVALLSEDENYTIKLLKNSDVVSERILR